MYSHVNAKRHFRFQSATKTLVGDCTCLNTWLGFTTIKLCWMTSKPLLFHCPTVV